MTGTTQAPRPSEKGRRSTRRRPASALVLAGVQGLVAVSALAGGWQLVATGYGMPVEWLARTPFDDWTVPGVLLWSTVTVPQLLGAAAALIRTPWWPRIGWIAGYLTGAGLVVWIVVQLAVLQRYFFLQAVIVGLGVLEIALAAWWQRTHPHG